MNISSNELILFKTVQGFCAILSGRISLDLGEFTVKGNYSFQLALVQGKSIGCAEADLWARLGR